MVTKKFPNVTSSQPSILDFKPQGSNTSSKDNVNTIDGGEQPKTSGNEKTKKPQQVGALRSEQTGRIGGVQTKERTFLGLSPEEAQQVLRQQAGIQTLGTGATAGIGGGDLSQQAQVQAQQEQLQGTLAQQLNELGAFEQEKQEPIGFSTTAGRFAEGQNRPPFLAFFPGLENVAQTISAEAGLTDAQKQEFANMNPEFAEEYEKYFTQLALERKNRDYTTKIGDAIGSLAEAIPFGEKVGSFVGFTTPSDKIDEIRGTIGKTDTFIDTQVQMGDTNPSQALENINAIQENLKKMEANLYLLLLESREVQTNSEEIARIVDEINIAQDKINRGKDQIALKTIGQTFEVPTFQRQLLLKTIQEQAKDL